MKKFRILLVVVLSMITIFSLAACGGNSANGGEPELPSGSNGANTIVVYFSCTNTTKRVAEYIQEELGCDIYEIVPQIPYTSADLNYNNNSSRSSADYGRNINIGKNVWIQQGCTFFDRGGIEIGDDTFIAPKVNLITLNHIVNPYERSTTIAKPIKIGKRVWIGIAATILPGVSVGDNSIIGAGAVVTKDVPPNVIAAGNPAKIIKHIEVEAK